MGSTVAIAGRCTPLMRPMTRVAAAIAAPVLPAEKKPSALPSLTSRHPTTIEESDLPRTAAAGCSPISMTWVVTTASQRSWSAAKASTTWALPTRSTRREGSAASAAATPSSTASGAKSPPIASTAMVVTIIEVISQLPVVG